MIAFVTAKETDAAAIADLRQKCWAAAYRGIYPDKMIDEFDYAWHERQDLARIQSDHYLVWRITSSGQNAGYLIIVNKKPLVLQSLYLLPLYQKRGIGSMAFELVRNYCKENGLPAFICHCQPENTNAMAFYQKMGGKTIARDEENEESWQNSVVFEFGV